MNDNLINELLARAESDEAGHFMADERQIRAEMVFRSSMYSGLGVKILSVIGGLLASLSFTGFLFSADLIRTGTSMLVFGLIVLAGSITLGRYVKNLTLDTAIVSANVIGYISIALAVNDLTRSDNLQAIALLGLSVLTILFTRSFMLVMIAVIIACNAVLALVLINDAHYYIFLLAGLMTAAYTSLHVKEAYWIAKGRIWNQLYTPIRIGILLSFLSLLFILSRKAFFNLFPSPFFVSSILITAGSIYVVWAVLRGMGDEQKPFIQALILFSVLVLLPALVSPAVSGSVLVLLVSFYTGHRNSIFIGLIALAYALITYYYDLEYSLLIKAGILFFSGLVFLTAWYWFRNIETYKNQIENA